MAEIFDKMLKYVGNDSDIWELAYIDGVRLKYLGNGISMQQMT